MKCNIADHQRKFDDNLPGVINGKIFCHLKQVKKFLDGVFVMMHVAKPEAVQNQILPVQEKEFNIWPDIRPLDKVHLYSPQFNKFPLCVLSDITAKSKTFEA